MSETRALAEFVLGCRSGDIPADVRHEAHRALLNIIGCSLGGARHPAVDRVLTAFAPVAGAPTASLLGRAERLDPLHAALVNGISSHVLDYDDTVPKNYGHHSSPVASALLAYASVNPVSGRDFVDAFVLGFDVSSRVANAVYPAHYDAGWHMTGTVGVLGAAAAVGRLLGLTAGQMVWALGLAATQSAGLREMFGSMAKSFHAGRAAQNGYGAALLAHSGFTAGEHGLDGPRGFAAVLASEYDLSRITVALGEQFELRDNTYKPFPCGIVIHPTIDGCIRLRHEHAIEASDVTAVRLRVAPLVIDLCNQRPITRGLQGKFSVYHGAAIGLVCGRAGLREFSDDAVNDPAIARVRDLTTATAAATVSEDQAHVEVALRDGRTVSTFVEASIGNVRHPLSDARLEAKFREQAGTVLPPPAIDVLARLCWDVDTVMDMREVVAVATPRALASS